VTGDNP